MLKSFEEFLKSGVVRKQSPDLNRARNLVLESQEKFEFFEKVLDSIGRKNLSPNYVVETCYDVLIELVRAKLLSEGYKTDSHEAEVSYLAVLGFSEGEVTFMNELRYLRNGIKYYGKEASVEDAEKTLKFLNSILPKLKNLVKDAEK